MADNSFEIKFAQLVDARLQEMSPSLYKRRVGFQLIEQEEDDTKGLGVIALMINNTWIYIPAFFLKGKIKMPALYIKKYDMCCPLNDSWTSFIKSNELESLGKGISERTLDLSNTRQSYRGLSNEDNSTKVPILDKMSSIENERDSFINNEDLHNIFSASPCEETNILEKISKEEFKTLMCTMEKHSGFANTLFEYYSPADLRKKAAELDSIQEEIIKPLVRKVTMNKIAGEDLSDDEKGKIITEGKVYKDDRKEHSAVYAKKIDKIALNTPNTAGFYKILMNDGSYEDMFVLFPKDGERLSYSQPGDYSCAIINPKKDPHKYFPIPQDQVLGKLIETPGASKKIGGSKASSLDKKTLYSLTEKTVLLVDKKGVAYEIPSKYSKEYNSTRYNGFKFTDKDGTLTRRNGILYIPNEVVYFTQDDDKHTAGCGARSLMLGNTDTFLSNIEKSAGLEDLTIKAEHSSYMIKSSKFHSNMPIRKEAAVDALIFNHGITETTANRLINNGSGSYLVKYAGIYDMNKELGNLEAKEGPKREAKTDLLPSAVSAVTNASETGLKEVIDVSVISSLVDTSRSLEKIGEYMPQLMKSMDRVGKILFMFYWNGEAFKEQYGTMELGDLEAKLIEVFNNVGDLVLYMKEKSVDSDSLFDGNQDNLSEDLGDIE